MRILIMILSLILSQSGCNGVFYQPSAKDFYDPGQLDLSFQAEKISSANGIQLAAFWFHSKAKVTHKKLVVHFHGNAENMTSHFLYSAWLTQEGFDVLTFDYRGYGRSDQVTPTRIGLVEDACAVFAWVREHAILKNYEVFIFGQSLGGAVAVSALAACPLPKAQGLIVDSGFSSYRKIARLKLGQLWLTWPLQYPLSFLVTDECSPIDSIALLPMKVLFFHSPEDPVVPYSLGLELYEKAASHKTWIDVEYIGHTAALAGNDSPYRTKLLDFLNQPSEGQSSSLAPSGSNVCLTNHLTR